MQRASQLFSPEQRQQIKEVVVEAESKTTCEIVPVVATASGRYDRAEDIVGLWLAAIAALAVWQLNPRSAEEPGTWAGMSFDMGLIALLVSIVVSFLIGAVVASHVGWLRRLFTPQQQMKDCVSSRAREVFFDRRVHHTSGGTGMLIYVSLFEHRAVVLADQVVLEKIGQDKLDLLCQQLTDRLKEGDATQAMRHVIQEAGNELAAVLPQKDGSTNELSDALVLID